MKHRDGTHWLTSIPIAHRGLHDISAGIPENSMAAFARAVDRGYAIELDVQLLKDGQVAVFHDRELLRMTGVEGILTERTSAELAEDPYRLQQTTEKIPLLPELLELVQGRVPLMVECKPYGRVGPLEKAVRTLLSPYRGAFAVQSFNPISVAWFRLYEPDWIRGQLAEDVFGLGKPTRKERTLAAMRLNWLSKPDYLHLDITRIVSGGKPAPSWNSGRSKGLPLLGYTAKTSMEYKSASAYFDNVLFEGFIPEDVKLEGNSVD